MTPICKKLILHHPLVKFLLITPSPSPPITNLPFSQSRLGMTFIKIYYLQFIFDVPDWKEFFPLMPAEEILMIRIKIESLLEKEHTNFV